MSEIECPKAKDSKYLVINVCHILSKHILTQNKYSWIVSSIRKELVVCRLLIILNRRIYYHTIKQLLWGIYCKKLILFIFPPSEGKSKVWSYRDLARQWQFQHCRKQDFGDHAGNPCLANSEKSMLGKRPDSTKNVRHQH